MSRPNSQKAACDRCRGQKLRCLWQAGEPQCQRCQRAGAVCAIPPARPMGRPRRQASDAARGWDGEHVPSALSGEDDTMMAMGQPNNADGPPDMFDIFQCLPNPDGLDVFSTSGSPMFATVPAMEVPDTGSSPGRTDAGSGGLGGFQLNGSYQQPLGSQGSEHAERDEHDKLLKQLCDINLCLSRHPLHQSRYVTAGRPPSASRGHPGLAAAATATTATTSQSPPSGNNNSTSTSTSNSEQAVPTIQSLSDLGVGNLLDMTCRLREAIVHFRDQTLNDEGRHRPGSKGLDRSTALVGLSCYARLEALYSRTLDVLVQARSGALQLQLQPGKPSLVLPEAIMDGFCVSRWPELQLNLLIYTCEQAHERIRTCMRNGDKALLQHQS